MRQSNTKFNGFGEPGTAEYISNIRAAGEREYKHPTGNELISIFEVNKKWVLKARLSNFQTKLRSLENKKDVCVSLKMKKDDETIILMNDNEIAEIDEEITKVEKTISFIKRQVKILSISNPGDKQQTSQPEISLDEIKEQVKIKDLLESSGIQIHRGNFFKLRSEKTPSCNFHPDKNLWVDHGSGDGGSILDLYMKINNCDVSEAIKHLVKLI